jgi:hypothetical protein
MVGRGKPKRFRKSIKEISLIIPKNTATRSRPRIAMRSTINIAFNSVEQRGMPMNFLHSRDFRRIHYNIKLL